MNLYTVVRSRMARGLDIRRLGPNESRILFDGAVSLIAAVAAYMFGALFVVDRFSPLRDALIFAAPLVLIIANATLGIYSRLRAASGETKAIVLFLGCLITLGVTYAFTGTPAIAVTWFFAATGPIVFSRLLLNLQFNRRLKSVTTSLNRNGPVLVIGGAGYIGSHAVEQLLERGYRVRVLDRLMYSGDSLQDFRSNARFEFIEGDAADIAKLTEAMRGASAVVHLAGLVGDPACAVDPEFTRHTNIVVTRMVRLVAQSMGVSRFIFASSCSVYGSSDAPVDELSNLNPVSLYAETKIDSERELLTNAPDDFFITVLRFATVFGHSRRPRFDLVANLFSAQAVTEHKLHAIGPSQWRPFVHVRDLGRAIAMVVAADPYLVQSQIFNVGDERLNKTILQLAELVRDVAKPHCDVEIKISDAPEDRRNYFVSFAKIHKILGFRASMSLEDGVREMIDHQLRGDYVDYRNKIYSNVAMTKQAVERFNDPEELSRLYAPLQR